MSRNSLPFSDIPIIVGGCHRSGTSLLRRIFNAHSRIHCGPEVKFFRDFFNDYFHDPLHHLRFAASARALLPESDLFDLLGRAFVTVQERAAQRAGKPRWADKNPENVLFLDEWARLLGSRWVFVHVVRNPLDTLASIKERGFPLSIPSSLEDRIVFYRKYLEAGIRFGEAHPSNYYRMQYERLVQFPETTLSDLMQWLGEEFEPGQLHFNRYFHQPGLEDPKIGFTSAVHAQSVGRWTNILLGAEADRIWSATRDLWTIVDPDLQYLPKSEEGP